MLVNVQSKKLCQIALSRSLASTPFFEKFLQVTFKRGQGLRPHQPGSVHHVVRRLTQNKSRRAGNLGFAGVNPCGPDA